MCVDHTMICTCRQNSADFDLKDEVMPHEVSAGFIARLSGVIQAP